MWFASGNTATYCQKWCTAITPSKKTDFAVIRGHVSVFLHQHFNKKRYQWSVCMCWSLLQRRWRNIKKNNVFLPHFLKLILHGMWKMFCSLKYIKTDLVFGKFLNFIWSGSCRNKKLATSSKTSVFYFSSATFVTQKS